MANISTQLADLAIVRSLLIQQVSNGLSADVAKVYNDIIEDLTTAVRGATPINLRNMNATIKELKERFTVDNSKLYSELEDLAVTESAYALNSVNSTVGIDVFSKIPTESTIRNIVATSLISDGKRAETINTWLSGIDTKMINDIEGVVKQGVITGLTNQDISSNLSNVLGVSRNHAETITRTATSMVSNEARQMVYDANDDVIKGYEFMATLDSRTSFGCSTRDGALYDTNRKPLNAKAKLYTYEKVPRHMNCLLGDTLVSTRYRISSISKRAYQGSIYTIKTALGNSIKCTPNHPILTDRGFVPAQFINKSDKIATDLKGEGLRILDIQDSKGVSTIENLFTSFSEVSGMSPVTMPTAPEDFHCDVTDDKVDVVFIERELWLKRYASFSKETSELGLISTNSSTFSFSHLYKNFMSSWNSKSSFMARLNLIGSLSPSHKRPFRSFLFGLTSKLNPLSKKFSFKHVDINVEPFSHASNTDTVIVESNSTLQNNNTVMPFSEIDRFSTFLNDDSIDDLVRDTELATNIINGTLGDEVFFDDIVDITIAENVSTHVYNLENELHYYTANNLINHNCRSIYLPTMKSWQELGIDMDEIDAGTRSSLDGQISADTTFDKWFEGKKKPFQEKYLGVSRYKLYKDGKITFKDLVNQKGVTLTVKELREKYN